MTFRKPAPLQLKKNARKKGFTLLEVMIAVTIMAIAFSAILSTQSSSISLSMKTKDMNVAGWLANNIMVEAEQLYEGVDFSEIPKETAETFAAPFERFKWKREIKEIVFPELQFLQDKPENGGVSDAVRMLAQVITKHLNKTIRELVVTISWPQGKAERTLVISTYLINLNEDMNFSI
jgi:prepilin-type N-terminal cleavage/methylation domain-containing protein